MKTTAAVLVQTGKPLELADLEIPALRPGQVLVEIAYSGVCHTQLLEADGKRGHDPFLPHCLGHEGSGTVIDVGPHVTRTKPGDAVILSWIKAAGANVPATTYLWNGRTVNAGAVTTFSRHAVVSENRVSAITGEIRLRDAAFVGCAVPTGAGAVFNTANVQQGQSVAVFGMGGIGLCAVAAASIRGAHPIAAIDLDRGRLAAAMTLGATHQIFANECDPVAALRHLCPGGIDIAIEATGRPAVMIQALEAVRAQGGTAVVIGNAPRGETIALDPSLLNQGKRLLGTWGGDNEPDRDFPVYCRMIAAGIFSLAPFDSSPYSLEEINRALDDLRTRKVARPIVDMSLK